MESGCILEFACFGRPAPPGVNPTSQPLNVVEIRIGWLVAAFYPRVSGTLLFQNSRMDIPTGSRVFLSLFGYVDLAKQRLRAWTCRQSSEFSGLGARLALRGGPPTGIIIAIFGAKVTVRRRADLVSLTKMFGAGRWQLLINRLKDIGGALVAVHDDYVWTLVLDQKYRRRGISRH